MKGFLAAALIATITGAATVAAAADYPDKPVHVIFPNQAGGGYHQILLAMQPILEKAMPVPMVVQAMPGAGTVTGTRYVVDQPPDGYTLLFIHEAAFQSGAMGTLGFPTLEKLQPIAEVSDSCPATFARGDAPYSNLAELAAYVKAHPDSIRAGVNIGALSHVEMLALGNALGFKPRVVHAGGGGGVRQALLANDIDLGDQNPAAVAALVKAGQLKALAYYGTTRHPDLPDVPTMAEQGFETPTVMCNHAFFWIRRDAPQAVKDYWTNLLKTELLKPDNKASLEKTLGVDIVFVGGHDMDVLADKLWKDRLDIVEEFGLKQNGN